MAGTGALGNHTVRSGQVPAVVDGSETV